MEKAELNSDTIEIAGIEVAPGTRVTIALPVTKLYTHALIEIPIHVIRGKREKVARYTDCRTGGQRSWSH